MGQDSVYRQTVTVNLENGLHMIPASMIAQRARGFACDIRIVKETASVSAKDVLEMMTLNAQFGTDLVLEAVGEEAKQAVTELAHLFETNFEANGSEVA